MNKNVLVAMSGGVDSSVAALLLKDQGYDVVGVHMKLWDNADVGHGSREDALNGSVDAIADCRAVCDAIGARLYVIDMSADFREKVIEDFVDEYRAGRTPNPCIRCNSEVRWRLLLQKAAEIGCDHVATGHYAFIEKNRHNRWQIRRGVDATRDQSYVVWGLCREALSRTLMPLGGLRKSEVREISTRHDLKAADRKESREICFVPDDDYRRFLIEYEAKRKRAPVPGDIVHENGTVLGKHKGTVFYTIGQRKGLGIAHPTPLYVQRIDVAENRVIVGDNDSLFGNECTLDRVNWVAIGNPGEPFEGEVKIRYLHQPAAAVIEPRRNNTLHVAFADKQRAITPGQSAVIYHGDVLLAGGVIASCP
jgi:tRNA-specific 2-thiouridylase